MDRTDVLAALDLLQERGYEPREAPYADLFELVASGAGTVRVVLYRDSTPNFRVYAFDKFMTNLWGVRFDASTPLAVVLAVIDAAEAELRAVAGRKVTA